jgi:nucleoside-diphosphate-sugar epimerase
VREVLVMGCEEFIGSRVMRTLTHCDWARPRPFDATHLGDLADALQDVDAVVNCLSGHPKVIEAAAKALFETASRCAVPPLIVHISSMSVYGEAIGQVAEDAPLQQALAPYARAKVRAEVLAGAYPRRVILRPGCEYGPGGELWSGRIAKWLYQRRVGDLGTSGDGYCNLVHIDDLVSAVLACLQRAEAIGRTFNLGAKDPPTWNEYFIRYARALRAVPVKRISSRQLALETRLLAPPLKALEIAAGKAGLASLTTPPIPPSLLRLMRQEIRLDCRRAERDLGWTTRPIEQGITETAAWYLRAGDGAS